MSRRISPQQLKIFKELIHLKRVLDVGDEHSQFLGAEFGPYAKAWTVVGRSAPSSSSGIGMLPDNLTVITARFDTWSKQPPSDFDIILLPSPSPSLAQDQLCLEWSSPDHTIIFFGDPQDDSAYGSPGFWQLLPTLEIDRDERDLWSRMLIFRKSNHAKAGEGNPKESHHSGNHPKKGDRFHLVASFRWPGKKAGERPPIVEVTKDWEKASGSAKIVGTGEMLHLHNYDLGNRM